MPRSSKFTVTLDDDPVVSRLIEKATGIPTVAFDSTASLKEKASSLSPSAAFIDLHLGEESGLDLIPTLREKWFYCPILVITSDPADQAVTLALAAGADDFVMKPLRAAELLARLQARWNDHARLEAKNVLRMGDVMMDCTYRRLRGRKAERHLSETEVSLLRCLWSAEETVVPREALKWQGWGQKAVSDTNLDRKLHDLRTILAETSDHLVIENSYGEGFALKRETNSEGRAHMKTETNPVTRLKTKGHEPLINEDKMKELSDLGGGGSSDFLQEIVNLFLTDAAPLAAQLEQAVAQKDAKHLKQYAHKMKGMCFNIGGDRLAAICSELEEMGTNGRLEGAQECVRRFQITYTELRLALESRLKKAA